MSFNAGDNTFATDLFANISRANDAEQVKRDTMIKGYTELIQDRSDANRPRSRRSQLPNNGVNDRDGSLLQSNGFMNDVINASSREQKSSSRFNYALDRQINKRLINVSGQFIPNEKLRVLPNRCTMMWGKHPEPIINNNINNLSLRLGEVAKDITLDYDPTKTRGQLKYNINNKRLTKEDLINSSSMYAKQDIQKISQQKEIQQILLNLDSAWV